MKFRLTGIVFLSIFCLSVISGETRAQSAKPQSEAQKKDTADTLEKAFGLFREGNFQKAAHLISLANDRDPNVSPPGTMLAKWATLSGNSKLVHAFLDDAVISTPDDPEAYFLLADLARADGRRTETTLLLARGQELLEGFQRSPERKLAIEKSMWSNLSALSEAKGDWNGALACLEKLAELSAEQADVSLLNRFALLYLKRHADGDEALAIQYFEKSFAVDPSQLPVKALLAQVALQKGETEKGDALLLEAVTAYPNHTGLLAFIINNHLANGRLEEARQSVEQLQKQHPDSAEIDKILGVFAFTAGRLDEAEAHYRKVLEKLPNDHSVTEPLILILLEKGNAEATAEATQLAENNLRHAPSQEAASLLSWVFYLTGKKETAYRLIDQVLSHGRLSSNAAYFSAVILADQGKLEPAKELIKTALQTKASFFKRKAAEQLLNELEAK